MRKILWAIAGIAVVAGTGWIIKPALAEGDSGKGKPIYEKHCLLCHGPQGRGDGPQGQLLKPPAASFRSPESKAKSDAELLAVIRDGHPDTAMTEWKDVLSEADMKDVLAYIRMIAGPPESM